MENDLVSVEDNLVGVKNNLVGLENNLVGLEDNLVGVENNLVGVGDNWVGVRTRRWAKTSTSSSFPGVSGVLKGINGKDRCCRMSTH